MHVLNLSPWLLTALASATYASPIIEEQKCSNFIHHHHHALETSNATLLNATYHAKNTFNVSNTFNTIHFCELHGSIPYGSTSKNNTLNFALWLPTETSSYASRFLAVGNGGMAGTIDYTTMLAHLNSNLGFAIAGGDAGHLASENNAGGGEPGVYLPYLHDMEEVQAWIHDAISLFTPTARTWTEVYYEEGVRKSYYYGCSTGGAQGFALAQFHPRLFDGVYAGCPGFWYSHLALSFLWNAQHTDVSCAGGLYEGEEVVLLTGVCRLLRRT